MDAMTFTSSIVHSVAWPAAAVGIAVVLRRDISALMRRLKIFKGPGGWEAEFEELEKVKNQVDQLIATRVTPKELEPSPTPSPVEGKPLSPASDAGLSASDRGLLSEQVAQLLNLAEISPSAAVMEAWSSIERELVDRARALNVLPEGRYLPTRKLIQILAERSDAVVESIASELSDLNRIRNNVAHARDDPIGRDAAVEYVLTAARVLTLLRIAL